MRSEASTFAVIDELGAALGERLVVDPDVLDAHRRDQASWGLAGSPVGLVRARTTAHVQSTVRVCARLGIPIVPRGAGSGLSGGANAVDGGVVLALDGMSRIVDVLEDEQLAVVEPGVINLDLKTAVSELGLWYPPDPASQAFSTLGGNIATNAGGLCCLKYGVTRDWVVSLEVVLADGSVIVTRAPTRKDVAGYDLTGLIVGSEGTLGIVTRAVVRLRPKPPPASTLVAFFPSLVSAGNAITAICRAVTPSLLELLDRATIAAVDDWTGMGLDRDTDALLLAQTDADTPQQQREELAAIERACRDIGATYCASTEDPDEGNLLLNARRLAYPALERLGATLLDDVALPRQRVAHYLAIVDEIRARHDVRIFTFGHAGDGNLHPTLVYDAFDQEERGRVQRAFDDLLREAIDMGGSITGEHGVGNLKAAHLPSQLGPDRLRVHRAIKAALDPANLLNPGKFL